MTHSDDRERTDELFDTPVAFSIYARPQCVRRLVAALRPVRPRRIFVFADGPKQEFPEQVARCREARAVVGEIDWPSDVSWNVADVNLGPRQRIQSGLTWVFEQVEEAIFFEEDCIPDPTFLPFCRELLTRYRSDLRVYLISGMRGRLSAAPAGPESYDFSIAPGLYGWAAWRRTWALYEANVDSWPALRSTDWLRRVTTDRAEARLWEKRFDLVQAGLDTWDYSLVFSCWKARGLSIRPRHDLVENIGFGPQGTNTLDADSEVARRRARPIEFPLVHPGCVEPWDAARKSLRRAKSARSRWEESAARLLEEIRRRVARRCHPMDRRGRLRRILRFPPRAPVELLPPVGTSLDLTERGVGEHALPYGWSFQEREGRWTVGLRAIALWRTDRELAHDLTCRVEATPALCPSQPGMRVDIFVNDVLCAGSSYGSPLPEAMTSKSLAGIERFRIPRGLLQQRSRMVLVLFVRWPLVPAEHDISDDFRALGLFVRAIRFEDVTNHA